MTKFIHWILDDHGIDDSMTVLEELEKIDDDCDKHGIQFVKIDDDRTSRGYGIDSVPAIVYFEKQIPNIYSGDLLNEEEILHWLVSQLEKDEIEDVTDEMLDRMVKEGSTLAVLFCKCELYSIQLLVWGSWPVMFRFIHFPDDNNDDKSQKVLEELENIDDECDALGITFVKIDNIDEAKEYGIDSVPSLLYFEKGIPTVYEGRLEDEESVLKWLEQQTTSDEIEDITDEMLDLILEKMPYVAVLFCKLICTFTLSSPPNPFSHVSILFSSVYCVLLLNHQIFSYSLFGLSTKWLKWPNKTNKKTTTHRMIKVKSIDLSHSSVFHPTVFHPNVQHIFFFLPLFLDIVCGVCKPFNYRSPTRICFVLENTI